MASTNHIQQDVDTNLSESLLKETSRLTQVLWYVLSSLQQLDKNKTRIK